MGNCAQPSINNEDGLKQLSNQNLMNGKPDKNLIESKLKDIMVFQLKSGISLEIYIYTKVPIKGLYSLTYKLDYGRTTSKWTEQISSGVYKS